MDFLFTRALSRLFNLNAEQRRYNPLTEKFQTEEEIKASIESGKYEDTSPHYTLDIKEDLKNGTMLKPASDRPFRSAWKMVLPYWYDRGKYNALKNEDNERGGPLKLARSLNWPALGLLGTVLGGTAFQIYMGVQLNFWGNAFGNSLQNFDGEAFWDLMLGDFSAGLVGGVMGGFVGLATVYIATAVWTNYLEARLEMNWRTWMTDKLTNKWLNNDKKSYYRLQNVYGRTENPDQRVSEDVGKFTSSFLGLTIGLGRNFANLASYSAILWGLSSVVPVAIAGVTIPGFMMWAVLAYAAVGSALTYKIGKPLVAIDYQRERKEADFRASLIRVKDNAESIALSGGEKAEKRILAKKFNAVVQNYWALIKRNKKLQWLTNYYEQAATVFPYIVAAPIYFSDTNTSMARQCLVQNAEQGGAAVNACNNEMGVFSLGDLNQLASAFGRVQDSLSWFIQAFPALASFKATTDRLSGFMEDIETSDAEVELIREGKAEGFRPYLSEGDNQPEPTSNGRPTSGPKLKPKI